MKMLYYSSIVAAVCCFIALAFGAFAIDAAGPINYLYIFSCVAIAAVMGGISRVLYHIWERTAL